MNALTPLQYGLLNGMMDDSEDAEQLYLMLKDQFSRRDIIDGLASLLRHGLIEIKYTKDESIAPTKPINFGMIDQYWFSPTQKGQAAWDAFTDKKST